MAGDEAADLSRAERWARLTRAARDAELDRLTPGARRRLEHDWSFWGRPSQQAPAGDWRVWLMMAGRGFGKTRAGAEWVRGVAEADGRLRIALVGATLAEARGVMVEGESGLMAIAPPGARPRFEPSLARLTWPNGARAHLYSAAEPEALRGPQHHVAWTDEIAKWPYGIPAWDNLALGLRLGRHPRVVATTTPKPGRLLSRLLVPAADVVVSYGRTTDNRANLPPGFVRAMEEAHGGTRFGRQELDGELLAEVEGALWTRAALETCRVMVPPAAVRVVVGVDPPASIGAGADACGIVVAGLGADGLGYVLEDASIAGARPEGWARAVSAAAGRHRADRVVAEANNGGAMVESVLRAADMNLPVRLVHASHGKVARAEPVAALYDRGRVRHAGAFPMLEDEMCGLVIGGDYRGPGRSPDRADALVWALTELMLGTPKASPGMRMIG